jgi:hypothetical protein
MKYEDFVTKRKNLQLEIMYFSKNVCQKYSRSYTAGVHLNFPSKLTNNAKSEVRFKQLIRNV